ncbi:hypothetical protein K435DRAFT_802816 [Dendrothele bispora CBS 962.96]|uniref:SnoaL-like domain-containing protein n=1 Tax=Dendrothele bispora (strain CBS 962.96) TaxID=1314807 RepID=A0A4V4HE09_DENBC|nr:hypothetical protein K435DRAFT_802816 [Dendrothele bispora CBS 962.96]
MAMHFHDLPVSVLALLCLQMHHMIASSADSLHSATCSHLPFHHKLRQETTLHTSRTARSSFGYHRINTRAIPSSIVAWDEMVTSIKNRRFNFFADIDPTHGTVKMEPDGTVFMKGDDTTWLADGELRNRLLAEVNGLFPKATVKTTPTATEQSLPTQVAGFKKWSRASYGEDFNLQGGSVYAMKWDENGIAVWSFFRAAVPADIVRGTPNPSQMGFTSKPLSNLEVVIQ